MRCSRAKLAFEIADHLLPTVKYYSGDWNSSAYKTFEMKELLSLHIVINYTYEPLN